MSEELRAREWRVNPETPSVIITPHGRISIGWSNQRAGEASEFALAEETAAMIVGLVNASFASSAAGQREGMPAWCEAVTRELEKDDSISTETIIKLYRAFKTVAASPFAPEERRDEVERDLLVAFVAALTDSGRNGDRCLSINHDELATLVKRARAALNQSQGER